MEDQEPGLIDLQMETITNRSKYTKAIQLTLDKLIKYKMEILENTAASGSIVKPLEIPNPTFLTVEDGVVKRKEGEDLARDAKAQIRAMEILISIKNCPINQILDKL